MTENNKKILSMVIIGALFVSTIGMTAVSGVFISKYNQERDQHDETYQDYLETLDNYEDVLEELQIIQDNTDFSGNFYGISQVNLNYGSIFSIVEAKFSIPYSDYFFYRLSLDHPSHSSSSLSEIAENIASYCKPDSVLITAEDIKWEVNDPFDDECVLDGLLTFCQDRGDFEHCIHYVDDGTDDFSKYPIETLCEGGGDCEDKSILFASLARALDYDVRICVVTGHVFVAVQLDSSPTHTDGWHISIDDESYYLCETTMYGWLIGDCPENYQGESVYSYPVL